MNLKGEFALFEEMKHEDCEMRPDPAPLPASPVPAMAYVPFQQWDLSLHSPEKALDAGTLFPVLDKPFTGGRRMPK